MVVGTEMGGQDLVSPSLIYLNSLVWPAMPQTLKLYRDRGSI